MATTFERDENAMYNIPQRFVDENFKICPFCGKEEPKWLTKEDWHLVDKTYCFKCPECESIMESSQGDVSGLAFSDRTPQGRKKKREGKIQNVIYIKIRQIGLDARNADNMVLEGLELPLERFKEWIAKHNQK